MYNTSLSPPHSALALHSIDSHMDIVSMTPPQCKKVLSPWVIKAEELIQVEKKNKTMGSVRDTCGRKLDQYVEYKKYYEKYLTEEFVADFSKLPEKDQDAANKAG